MKKTLHYTYYYDIFSNDFLLTNLGVDTLPNTIFEKKPAFFRVTSAEMFFEADSEVSEDIQLDEAVEKEIDDLLESIQTLSD